MSFLEKLLNKSKWIKSPVIKNNFLSILYSFFLIISGLLIIKFAYKLQLSFEILAYHLSIILFSGALRAIVDKLPKSKGKEYLSKFEILFSGLLGYYIDLMFKLFTLLFSLALIIVCEAIILLTIYEIFGESALNDKLIFFIFFLFTILLLSYYGSKTIFFVSKLVLYPRRREKNYKRNLVQIRRFINEINFKQIGYILATLLYIFSVTVSTLDMAIIDNESWVKADNLILQAFLCFIAIDRYISKFHS